MIFTKVTFNGHHTKKFISSMSNTENLGKVTLCIAYMNRRVYVCEKSSFFFLLWMWKGFQKRFISTIYIDFKVKVWLERKRIVLTVQRDKDDAFGEKKYLWLSLLFQWRNQTRISWIHPNVATGATLSSKHVYLISTNR